MRMVYKYSPDSPPAGLSGNYWKDWSDNWHETKVIPDTPEDLEASKADGFSESPTVPEKPPEPVKMRKGNKVATVAADQVEASKADGWEIVGAAG